MTVKNLIRMDTSINSSSFITIIVIDDLGEEIKRRYAFVSEIIKDSEMSKYKVDTFRHYSSLEIFTKG